MLNVLENWFYYKFKNVYFYLLMNSSIKDDFSYNLKQK